MIRRDFLLTALALGVSAPSLAASRAVLSKGWNFQQMWEEFKRRHIREGRVVDSYSKLTHSEGQGYALLFAVWAGDEPTFKQLWAFTRLLRRPDGLFSWKWERGRVTDPNNATDAEIYIAWALIEAARVFSSTYLGEAQSILTALRPLRRDTPHGPVLLPGVEGFIEREGERQVVIVNPSYWIFPAFSEFGSLTGDPFWASLTATGLRLLDYGYFGRHRLPPDWLRLTDPLTVQPRPKPTFGYDAIRVPLFLAWGGHLEHPAISRFLKFARSPEFPGAVNLLDDSAVVERAPAFSAVKRYLDQVIGSEIRQPLHTLPPDYYGLALLLLTARATPYKD